MSKRTVLLILVWNASVNTAFMVLLAVHVHFKDCGTFFPKAHNMFRRSVKLVAIIFAIYL